MTSMLLILSFLMKHGITADAFADLLVLVELHCISPNIFKKTTKLFTQFFKELRSPVEFHYYCTHGHCLTYLGQKLPDVCPTCLQDLTNKKNYSYFVVVPIAYQLQSLFSSKYICRWVVIHEVWRFNCTAHFNQKSSNFFFKSGGSLLQDILTLKASHKRKKDPGICDVLDGRLYKEYFNSDGFIRGSSPQKNEVHISFQVNTDGVSLFRSSKFAVWPVYLIINEIPPNYRWTILSNFSLYNRDVSKKLNCQSVKTFKLLKLESALFYCVMPKFRWCSLHHPQSAKFAGIWHLVTSLIQIHVHVYLHAPVKNENNVLLTIDASISLEF